MQLNQEANISKRSVPLEKFRVFTMEAAPLGVAQPSTESQPVLVKYDIESGQTWITLVVAQQTQEGQTLGKLVWFPIQDMSVSN